MYWKNSKTENHQLGIGIDWHQILLVSNIYIYLIYYLIIISFHVIWFTLRTFLVTQSHSWEWRVKSDKVTKVPNPGQEAGLSSSFCNILAKLASWIPSNTERSERNLKVCGLLHISCIIMYLCLENWPHKQFKHGRFTFPFGAQRNLGYLSGQSQPAHVTRCN